MTGTANKLGATRVVAEAIAKVTYQDLPADVVEAIKKSIIDTLGVTLAATTLGGDGGSVAELVREWGGREEATILGFGGRVPVYGAVFAFGALAHQLDYDDVLGGGVVHPTAPTLSAALPMAERLGGVTGKEMIAAVALGNEMMIRLSRCVTTDLWGLGWLQPSLFGGFSAGTAAGKLLKLDADQLVDMLGLTMHQAGGTLESAYNPGSSWRGLRDGFAAKAGVTAALLAERGVPGDKQALEGKYGLLNLHLGGKCDPTILLGGFGETFSAARVGYKMWPSCAFTHGYLTAVSECVRRNGLVPDDVARITLSLGKGGEAWVEPREFRVKPTTSMDAKWSLPFLLGKMVQRGQVGLEDFTSSGLNDSAAHAIAQRVDWKIDPSLPTAGTGPGVVSISTQDGRTLSQRSEYSLGHPENPVTWDDLISKFKDCCRHSVHPLGDAEAQRIVDLVRNIEDMRDVGELLRRVSANGQAGQRPAERSKNVAHSI